MSTVFDLDFPVSVWLAVAGVEPSVHSCGLWLVAVTIIKNN
jgi:hypothetical protein